MTASALARMARMGDAAPAPIDPTDLLGRAIARACDQGAGLDVHLQQADLGAHGFAEALAQIAADDLLIALQRGGVMVGAVAMCAEFRSAVVEIQATGTLRSSAAKKRAASGTDAALASQVVTRFLTECAADDAGTAIAGMLDDLCLGARLHSTRVMELTMTQAQINVITVSVQLAQTDRVGQFRILVPDAPPTAPPPRDQGARWDADWPRLARNLPVRVEAILHKMPISLSRLKSLEPGTCLALPGADLGGLVLRDVAGGHVAKGRLGQVGGRRAVRLQSPEPGAAQLEELGTASAAGPDLLAAPVDLPEPMDMPQATCAAGPDDLNPIGDGELPEAALAPMPADLELPLTDLPMPSVDLPAPEDPAPDLDLDFPAAPMDLPEP